MESNILQAAQDYVNRLGLSVIPIATGTKQPPSGWKLYQTRKPTPEELKVKFNGTTAGIGAVSGNVSGGLVIFDHDGERWQEGHQALHQAFPRLPFAAEVETGSGKRHDWLFVDGLPDNLTKEEYWLGPQSKIEVRANRHQTLLPPSIHPDTLKPYRFLSEPDLTRRISYAELKAVLAYLETFKAPTMRRSAAPPAPLPHSDTGAYWLKKAIAQAGEENRNDTGYWLANQYRDNGLSEIEAEGYMRQYAQAVRAIGDHVYTEEEAIASLHSSYNGRRREPAKSQQPGPSGPTIQPRRKAASPELPPHPAEAVSETTVRECCHLTDLGNAYRLRAQFGHCIRYNHDTEEWYQYDETRWGRDTTRGIFRLNEKVVQSLWREAGDQEEASERKRLGEWARKSESEAAQRAAIALARTLEPIAVNTKDFDRHLFYVNVANGVLDCETGRLLPHDPRYMLTQLAPVDYDPDRHPELWLKFIREITKGDGDLENVLQVGLGMCLTGDISERIAHICHGGGRNGKSTCLGVVHDVLGDYAWEMDAKELMEISKGGISETTANLLGKRFVKVEEGKARDSLDAARLKQWLSGQTTEISAERKYGHQFRYKPQFKLWFATNHLPKIDDATDSIWDRIRLLPFNVRIAAEDPKMPSKLLQESGAILHWLLEGCLRWQRQGVPLPEIVRAATQDYRDKMDAIGRFVEECCVQAPQERARVKNLYQTYGLWCSANGAEPVKASEFNDRLDNDTRFHKKPGTGNYLTWFGIGIRPDLTFRDEP